MEKREIEVELNSQLVDVLKAVLLNKLDFDNVGEEKGNIIQGICKRLEEAEKVFEKDMEADCDIKLSDEELDVVCESLQRQIKIEKANDIKGYFENLLNLFTQAKESGEKLSNDSLLECFESSEKDSELNLTVNYEDVTLLEKVLREALDNTDTNDKDYELLDSWFDTLQFAGMALRPEQPNEDNPE